MKRLLAMTYMTALLCLCIGIAHGESSNMNDPSKKDFMIDAQSLSASNYEYGGGPTENLKDFFNSIIRFLVIAIPTLAVLFMVVGGIKIILAGGDSNEINNGKKIIHFNIIAVVITFMSYAFINLVIWLVGNM